MPENVSAERSTVIKCNRRFRDLPLRNIAPGYDKPIRIVVQSYKQGRSVQSVKPTTSIFRCAARLVKYRASPQTPWSEGVWNVTARYRTAHDNTLWIQISCEAGMQTFKEMYAEERLRHV